MPKPRVLTPYEVSTYAMRAGFNYHKGTGKAQGANPEDSELVVAVAIAGAESGWDANAVNAQSGATGLWQIYPGKPSHLDPYRNALAAHAKYKAQGWEAWSAYKSGRYVAFLDKARGSIEPALGRAEPGLNVNPLGIVDLVRSLFSGALWLRVLMVIGGAILGLIALNALLKTFGVNVPAMVSKGAVT